MTPSFRLLILGLTAALTATPSTAELVDFTGLDSSGGTFSTSIDGNTIIGVTVGPIANVGAEGSSLEASFSGEGLRQVTQNAGGTYDAGDQSSYTVTLAQEDVFTLSTNSGDSAADGRDILRITPSGVPAGGDNFWLVSGTSNVDVSEDANHVLTLAGNGANGVFMTYMVSPGEPLASFTVTHESTVSGTTVNSHILDLDVSTLNAIDVPALDEMGLLILGFFFLSAALTILRRRIKS